MSEKSYRKRVVLEDNNALQPIFEQGKSAILNMGHYGNWEWMNPVFSLHYKASLSVIYKPLSDVHFDKKMIKVRSRFGAKLIPMKKAIREIIKQRNEIHAYALVADQTPTKNDITGWVPFLNQDTPVFTGPEKIAKTMGFPVVYVSIKRTKRGYYKVIPSLIEHNPKDTEELEITRKFYQKLEQDIKDSPEIWLWSHKRWKHKRNQHVDN